MTARIPQPGEVWVQRWLAVHGRGHVTILDVADGRVRFRYMGSGTDNDGSLAAFAKVYLFAAATVDTLPDSEFPRRPIPTGAPIQIRPGTAVAS